MPLQGLWLAHGVALRGTEGEKEGPRSQGLPGPLEGKPMEHSRALSVHLRFWVGAARAVVHRNEFTM